MGSVVPQYINCNSGELKQGVSYISPEDYEDQIDGASGNYRISHISIYESNNEQILSALFHNKASVSRAERNQAVWRSKSVPLERRCSAKMSAYDGCRREPLVAARLVEPMRQGNRWLSAW